jgi:hypothetical protein
MPRLCIAAFSVLALAAGCQPNDRAMRSENQAVASANKGARSVATTGADGRLTRKSAAQVQARPAAGNQRPDWDWLGVTGSTGKSAANGAAAAAGSSKRPDWDWLGITGKDQATKSGSQRVAMGDWLVKPPEQRQQWSHVKARHKNNGPSLPPDPVRLGELATLPDIAPSGQTPPPIAPGSTATSQ